jgi:ACS family hexuronate transporter-like MFS transporter
MEGLRRMRAETGLGSAAEVKPVGSVRWMVCGLLFFATTINYIDRQVLSILKPLLQNEMGWSETDYGWITSGFTFGYAFMMPLAGRLIDRLGTRMGYALAVIAWSMASMSHAFASSVVQFVLARFALGVAEAANFPAAVRTVADWFPQKERSLATGIFNSGSNVGLVIAAGAPFIALWAGWQAAFLFTGVLGGLFLLPWLLWYRQPSQHPWLSRTERSYIESGQSAAPSSPSVSYSRLLKRRAAWAFAAGKFLTDPVWWFFIFWIPSFLNSTYGVNVTALGPPLLVIYLAADVGSIGGGWVFKGLAARGWSPNASRKTAMILCALAALPILLMLYVESLWPAVAILSIAAAAHQGWSVNLFTLVSDTFPGRMVASVVGFGGMAGGIAGMLVQPAVGRWLDLSGGSYRPLFVIAAAMYLLAFVIIHALVPTITRDPEEAS